MNSCLIRSGAAVLVGCLLCAFSLGQTASTSPKPVRPRLAPPRIDTSQAVAAAMKQYDKNKDGLLRGSELDRAPELKAVLKQLDRNRDGAIRPDEIASRIEAWKASQLGLMVVACEVHYRGRPLAGAKVVWEPVPWLGKSLKPAEGATDAKGLASMAVPKSPLPGVAPGLYLVKITHPKVKLPEEFNKRTSLTVEVATDAKAIELGAVRFDLQPQGVDAPRSSGLPR